MTYTVKEATDILNLRPIAIYKRCKKLGIKTKKIDLGYTKIVGYEFTDHDIEMIKSIKPRARNSKYRNIGNDYGLTDKTVLSVAGKVKKYVRKDEDKLRIACQLWKTKLFTTKGLTYFINEWGKTGQTPIKGIKARI